MARVVTAHDVLAAVLDHRELIFAVGCVVVALLALDVARGCGRN